MNENELKKDVIENNIANTKWIIEDYSLKVEFLNSLESLDEARTQEKQHYQNELDLANKKKDWLSLKLEEINAIIESQT